MEPLTIYRAACRRAIRDGYFGDCGWTFSDPDFLKVATAFMQHLKEKHPECPPGSIGLLELDCEIGDVWQEGEPFLSFLFDLER